MKKKKIDKSKTDGGLGTMGGLFQAAGFEANPTEETPKPVVEDAPPLNWKTLVATQTQLFIRLERKGRKGKTVTIVSRFSLPKPALTEIARAMSKALGCGSTVEITPSESQIVLQGNNVSRAAAWLQKHNASLK